MGMNLFGHIVEHYDPEWGYDPESVPTYPPVINNTSSPEELHMWNIWWTMEQNI